MFPNGKHFHVAAFVLSYTVLVTTELARRLLCPLRGDEQLGERCRLCPKTGILDLRDPAHKHEKYRIRLFVWSSSR